MHIEILKDSRAFSAQQDHAGISDIILEAAVSTICDNEDSVAAVDAEDKVVCYRNWLGLMKGNLKTQFEKDGKLFEENLIHIEVIFQKMEKDLNYMEEVYY